MRVYSDKQQDAFSSDIGLFLPKFVLCLRDFSNDLNDKTPDEYLQGLLSVQHSGKDESDKKYNRIRACIQCFFTNRKCCIFDPPALGRTNLSRLGELDDKDISDVFLKDAQVFIDYIYSCQPKQLLDGKTMNGRMFSTLTRHYVEVIKTGQIPCIDDALTSMAEKENLLAAKAAVAVFKEKMKHVKIPISDMHAFEKTYREAQQIGLEEYRSKSVLDITQELSRHAEKEMDDIRQKYIDESRQKQEMECNKALQDIYDTRINQKILSGVYKAADGYKQYRDDFVKLKSQMYRMFPHVDGNTLKFYIMEFEDKYRDKEDELLKQAEISKEKMIETLRQTEKEKNEIMTELQTRRSKEKEQHNILKSENNKNRDAELADLKEKHNKTLQDWEEEKQKNQDVLQQQNKQIEKLLSRLRSEQETKIPSVPRTVLATIANLVPIAGPIVYQVIKHKSESNSSQELANVISDVDKKSTEKNKKSEEDNKKSEEEN